MAISKIQYDNKVAINIDSTIPDINKCNASDLNEIKSVVNNNADEIPSKDNLVNVGSSVDTDYKVNVITTKNLIPTNTNIVPAYTFNTSGSWVSNANYLTIGDENTLIKVQPNTTYTFTSDVSITKYLLARIYNFTSSKTWISRSDAITITSNGFSYTTGSTTEYISIGLYTNGTATSGDLTQCQLEEGSTASTYQPFIPNTINVNNEKYTDTINVGTDINNKNRINVLYSHNLFDKNNANVLNAYFVDGTNNITADTSGNNKTIYIPCKPNTTYTIQKTASPSNRAIGYTTTTPAVNVTVQGAINILANTTSKIITTGNNAQYLVIRVWSGTQDTITFQEMLDSVMINEGSEALPYEPYVIPSINVDGEEIYSKPVVLYDNPSGTTGDAILNDIPTNYKYIEIFYNDDQLYEGSLKIKGSTHPFILSMVKSSGVENAIFLNSVRYSVVNNTLKYEKTVIMKLTSSGIALSGSSNVLKIYQVLGYK